MKFLTSQSLKSISMAAVLLAVSTSLFAAKGGGVTGSLWLVTPGSEEGISFFVDGETSESVPKNYPNYGDFVVFGVDVSRGDESEIRTKVLCTQDGYQVYFNRDDPGHAYEMKDSAGKSSAVWDGGTAQCTALLIYCPSKGKNRDTCEMLDSAEYTVTGSAVE